MRPPLKEKSDIEHAIFRRALASLAAFHGGCVTVPLAPPEGRMTYEVKNGSVTLKLKK